MQRCVFIDPGRRELLYARIQDYGPRDPATGDYGVVSTFTYSIKTAHVARLSQTRRTAEVTLSSLRSAYLLPPGASEGDAETEHVTLLEHLERLPNCRAFEAWRNYEQAALPLLSRPGHRDHAA